jgi:hypothetical protein
MKQFNKQNHDEEGGGSRMGPLLLSDNQDWVWPIKTLKFPSTIMNSLHLFSGRWLIGHLLACSPLGT